MFEMNTSQAAISCLFDILFLYIYSAPVSMLNSMTRLLLGRRYPSRNHANYDISIVVTESNPSVLNEKVNQRLSTLKNYFISLKLSKVIRILGTLYRGSGAVHV